ncbi:MAG: ATP-binding cassette domain-containing protein [Spirochaetota bacterium]
MSDETVLRVEGLMTEFGGESGTVKAVNGISFDLHRGEILGIVGESGSGKSVTNLSILRLVQCPPGKIAAGKVIFQGRDPAIQGRDLLTASEEEVRVLRGKNISMIFQDPLTSLNPVLKIGMQIGEAIELHHHVGRREARAKSIEMLRLIGIPDPERRADDYPHQFSGGMRQRVMIAMALSCKPDILIADEPTTALDVTIQAQILELLKELQRELGMAVLFITHNLEIVRRIATRVAVMHDGLIVETKATADLFAGPEHPYTRSLLDAEPKSDPPQPDLTRPVLLQARELKVWFPIQHGLLRRTSGYVKAVDGVDLELRKGETLGIAGESGSGKTTIGKALLRLNTSEGQILLDGEDVHPRSENRLEGRCREIGCDAEGGMAPVVLFDGLAEGVLGVDDQGIQIAEVRLIRSAPFEIGRSKLGIGGKIQGDRTAFRLVDPRLDFENHIHHRGPTPFEGHVHNAHTRHVDKQSAAEVLKTTDPCRGVVQVTRFCLGGIDHLFDRVERRVRRYGQDVGAGSQNGNRCKGFELIKIEFVQRGVGSEGR